MYSDFVYPRLSFDFSVNWQRCDKIWNLFEIKWIGSELFTFLFNKPITRLIFHSTRGLLLIFWMRHGGRHSCEFSMHFKCTCNLHNQPDVCPFLLLLFSFIFKMLFLSNKKMYQNIAATGRMLTFFFCVIFTESNLLVFCCCCYWTPTTTKKNKKLLHGCCCAMKS